MSCNKFHLFLFFFLSLCIASFGAYFSDAAVYPLSKFPFLFNGISRDEWSAERFSIDLKEYLPSEGGQISVQLSPWRPEGISPLMNISVNFCGKYESYPITPKSRDIKILVPSIGECTERIIDFVIDPPFVTKDKRTLGVKIVGVTFKGLFKNIKIKLVSIHTIFLFIACVFSIYAFHWAGASIVMLASFWVLSHQFWDVQQEVFMFFCDCWICFTRRYP